MSKVIFRLRKPQMIRGKRISQKDYKPKVDEPLSIYLRFRIGKKELSFYTGQQCTPKDWNPQTMRPRNSKATADDGVKLLSRVLDGLETAVKKRYNELVADDRRPTIEAINAVLVDSAPVNKPEREQPKKSGLLSLLSDFADGKTGNYTQSGKEKSPATRTTYRVSLKHLRDFKKDLDFEDIDLTFREKYIAFLTSKGLGPTARHKEIKNVKTAMNYALLHGLTVNSQFKLPGFGVQAEKTKKVFLSDREILALYEFEFTDKRHEITRDFFVFLCKTGMAFEDAANGAKIIEHKGTKLVTGKRRKSGIEFAVPLDEISGAIVAKYGGLPPSISNQKTNFYLAEVIKTMAEKTGWNKLDCDQEIAPTGKIDAHAAIGTHTGRRSFISNAIIRKTPREVLAACCGFAKGSKELETYYLEERRDAALRMPEVKQARQRAVKRPHRVIIKRPNRSFH
jgi:hypothetical protein